MRELRKHFTMGLVLLMCALTGHSSESAPSAAPETPLTCRGVQRYLRRVVEIVKHVEESRGRHSARTEAPFTMRARTSLVEPKDLRHLKIKNKGKESVGEWPLAIIMGVNADCIPSLWRWFAASERERMTEAAKNKRQVRSTSVQSAGSMCTDCITTPETARYLHLAARSAQRGSAQGQWWQHDRVRESLKKADPDGVPSLHWSVPTKSGLRTENWGHGGPKPIDVGGESY
ncbi:hypothetical protein Q8A73_018457 [Channa argus]|nr:hypothetical protein Q8A73_018457 [Channa argus]